jgi:hypothetical protein
MFNDLDKRAFGEEPSHMRSSRTWNDGGGASTLPPRGGRLTTDLDLRDVVEFLARSLGAARRHGVSAVFACGHVSNQLQTPDPQIGRSVATGSLDARASRPSG